eukprot:CAMPEP_0197468678 /NCGR_PEP_ID=MMETSP1175-20131217/66209_1 /TAXON_ID=1003142 /ORGANISM="Triceratium dubium, Strain CCMP147" /LENGTH=392 /DNA_ID=CAMNT_0043004789 /DNA_START=62 /DNA_END=1238 /DNA_ORIENTATION=+
MSADERPTLSRAASSSSGGVSHLRSLLNVPTPSQYDNSSVRRCLAATSHSRRSIYAQQQKRCPDQFRELEKFASQKFAFAFFNTTDTTDGHQGGDNEGNGNDEGERQEERVHPLFAALALGATVDVVRALYEACPKALGETTRTEGLTPLHLAARYGACCKVVEFLLHHCPSHAGRKALHLAARYGACCKVVEFLLHHCPSHAGRKSKGTWMTPLHYAAASSSSCRSDVVRALAVASPASLRAKDRRGNAPLHRASLSRSTSEETVRTFVAMGRSALGDANDMGMTPIHALCLGNAQPSSVLELMLNKHPEGRVAAASAEDRHGNTAAHYAVSHGSDANPANVRALLECKPECASGANRQGHTPVDVAAFDSSTPKEVLESLDCAVRLSGLE